MLANPAQKKEVKITILSSRSQVWLSLSTCSLLHIALGFLPLGRDQGVWLSVGSALLNGKDFITDILHFNLPGLGITYAFFQIFTDNPHIVVAAASLFSCIVIIISGFYLLKSSANIRIAMIFCWSFAFIYPLSIDYYNIAQKDMLAMSWLMAAFATFNLGQQKANKSILFFITGLFVAFSVFHKPVFGITGIFLALIECFRFKQHQSISTLLKNLTGLLFGFLVPVALYVAYLWKVSALNDAWMALQFAAWYSNLTDHGFIKLTYLLTTYVSLPNPNNIPLSLVQLVLWLPLSLFGLYKVIRLKPSSSVYILWLLVFVSIFTYYIQGKGFPYQAFPVIIICFIAVSFTIDCLLNKSKNNPWIKGITFGIVSFLIIKNLTLNHYSTELLPYLFGNTDRLSYLDSNFHPKDSPDIEVSESLGQWIEQALPAEETIHVWGMENYIYTLAKRQFPTRHHFHFFLYAKLDNNPALFEWQQQLHKEFLSEISTNQPAIFIETHYAGMKEERYLTVHTVSQFTPINNWLKTNYRLEQSIDRLDIWIRNDLILPPFNPPKL